MANATRIPIQLEDLIQRIHNLLRLTPNRAKELKSARTRKELYERALSSEEPDDTGLAVDKAYDVALVQGLRELYDAFFVRVDVLFMAIMYFQGHNDIVYNEGFVPGLIGFVPGLIDELVAKEPDLIWDFFDEIMVEIADHGAEMRVDEVTIDLKRLALYCAERMAKPFEI